MKSMFEYFGTIFILLIVSFIYVGFISIELQEINARNYHTRVIEKVQNKGDYSNSINDNYEGIKMLLMDDGSLKVTYSYEIKVPIIGTIKPEDIIGYAR